MVKFYTEALALKSLSPIQLTSTQQMILTGVGSGQIKLSAGQQGNRKYDLTRRLEGRHRHPHVDADLSRRIHRGEALRRGRLQTAGVQEARGDGTRAALVKDPGGFDVLLVIRKGAKDGSNDGVGVGIGGHRPRGAAARFYREFVGLDELAPIQDKYPRRDALSLSPRGDDPVPVPGGRTGGRQRQRGHPVRGAAMRRWPKPRASAAISRIETPLNKLAGFNLITDLAQRSGRGDQLLRAGRSTRGTRRPGNWKRSPARGGAKFRYRGQALAVPASSRLLVRLGRDVGRQRVDFLGA